MRALLLSLALLLVAMPLASAQGLPNTTSCGISVASTTPDNVPEGGSASVTITVTNTGSLAANVTVAATFAASDTGWHVTPASQSVNSGPAPAGKPTTLFTVTADKGAKPTASLNVAATAACAGPNGLPCPVPQQCAAQAPALTISMNVQASQGFRIPGLDALGFPIEYLVAGIVLIIVTLAIVLLLRRRAPAGAMLTCPEPLKFVKPGRGASFPIEVKNTSDKPTRLGLGVGAVPEGWSAFLPLPEIQLAAKETRGLWLMVRAPDSAKAGDAVDVEILATDPAVPNKPKKMRVRAEVSDSGSAESA